MGIGQTLQLGFPKRNLARYDGEADGVAAVLDFAVAVVFCFVSPQQGFTYIEAPHEAFCNTSRC